jgi:hypothetical protein
MVKIVMLVRNFRIGMIPMMALFFRKLFLQVLKRMERLEQYRK